MSSNKPKISVIIPVVPGGDFLSAWQSLKKINYPAELIEVIMAFGFNPSVQRNAAAKKARGEILYFLDNDSAISPLAFKWILAAFANRRLGKPAPIRTFSLLPKPVCRWIEKRFFSGRPTRYLVGAVGGPNLWNKSENFWSSVVGIFFDSFFAYFTMTSRFRQTGDFRFTDERELVLCNLAVKKKVFLKSGGFKDELYPNEENEFLGRLNRLGVGLIYHPGIFVNKPRRQTLGQILRMFFHYGRGRMENIRVAGLGGSWLFFLPSLFFLYLLVLVWYHPWWFFSPLGFYLLLGFGSALGFAVHRKKIYLALFLPWLFLLAHLTYGMGMFYGLTTNLKKKKLRLKKTVVEVLKLKNFGDEWPKK